MSAVLIIILLAAVPLVPLLVKILVRHSLRFIGWSLQRRTSKRRELIASRVKTEEDAYQTALQGSPKAEDDDWEQIEGYAVGTAPNGELPTDVEWQGVIGFFHPFCNAGGGGERVLWAAIRATQKRWPKAICVVYSGDHNIDRPAMIGRVKDRFGITLHAPTLILLYLSTRHLVLASTYPRFTLLGQSLGSLALAYDAFSLLVPDIFIDTMGYAFTLAFCHYLFPAIPTAAYVHYPTISTDMLDSLNDKSGERGLNAGAGAGWKGQAKKLYWRLFAALYGWVGSKVDLVMCNSSWTRGHISALWKASGSTSSFAAVVWPPCAVEEMESRIQVSAASEKKRERLIVYIAQFRPEKNHALVLRAFAKYYHAATDKAMSKQRPKLVLIGSVRSNTSDDIHIYNLRLQARELKIEEATTFICDASFSVVLQQMQKASIGVNGMWNEHFGIGVVEYLAAGLIPVVHDSGGPKLDIVVPHGGKPTGYHAETDVQFATAFGSAFRMSDAERLEMRQRNRESAKRFTEEAFARKWIGEMEELVQLQIARAKVWLKVRDMHH